MQVNPERLQHNFSRAAANYDALAQLQHAQNRRVLEVALATFPQRATLVDIGCGTGYFAAEARKQRPNWRLLGVDRAQGMCARAQQHCSALVGDASHLPLADGSVDGAVSSLCYQWVEDCGTAFAELARVLKPQGKSVLATLGAETLTELRACATKAELPLSLLSMRSMEDCASALTAAGLSILSRDRRVEVRHYPTVRGLLDSMRGIGAGNNFARQGQGVLAPHRWKNLLAIYERHRTAEGIPATWEYHSFIVEKHA